MDDVTRHAYARIMLREGTRLAPTTLPDGCLLWPGATTGKNRYGRVLRSKTENTSLLVHRVVFAVSQGISVDELGDDEVLHECDTPLCYEVTHLSRGTHQENMTQMAERGRVSASRLCQRCGRSKAPGRCPACTAEKRERSKLWTRRRYLRTHPNAALRAGEERPI